MKYCTVKSQIAETHLSPASREQTNSRKRANQGTAVEERARGILTVHRNQSPSQRNPVEVPSQESAIQKASLR